MAKKFLSIGLMSGTSMDGVDAVLLATDGLGYAEHLAGISIDYDFLFKSQLRLVEAEVQAAKGNLALVANKELFTQTIQKSTEYHIKACTELLIKASHKRADIEVIGYHGQSLYHNPKLGISIQISDGQLMANQLGIPVVTDFRIADIQNGGQGAPLAPIYHQALALHHRLLPVVIINCGGIANVSIISGDRHMDALGFDTGPGNVLIDRYIRERSAGKEFMDKDGQYGLKGAVSQEAIVALYATIEDYLMRLPPKSLDPSNLIIPPLVYSLSFEDACATLESFTAQVIVESINRHNRQTASSWILAGGGWKNPVILRELKRFATSDISIKSADSIGWSNTYMEAEIFSYLAIRSLLNLPITYPTVTGCRTPTLGGKIFKPDPAGL